MSLFRMQIMERNQDKVSFTWEPTKEHHQQAVKNHSQSLQRLNERGGLNWLELYWILTFRAWGTSDVSPENAQRAKNWCVLWALSTQRWW